MDERTAKIMLATEQTTEDMLGIVESRKSLTLVCLGLPTKIQKLAFLDAEEKYHDSGWKVNAFFADIWSGKVECTDDVEHCIDLTQNFRLFWCAPNRAGLKTRDLKKSKIQKRLKVDVFKLAALEWALLVLFVLKNDESFSFCKKYCRIN